MTARKYSKLTDEHKQRISNGMKKAIADKRFTPQIQNLTGRKAGFKATEETKIKQLAKKKGVPQPLHKNTGAHTNNVHAKKWAFINKAKGFVLEGKNLSQLLRDNSHMFDKDDLIPYKSSPSMCRASVSLSTLSQKRASTTSKRHSWKGWMLKI